MMAEQVQWSWSKKDVCFCVFFWCAGLFERELIRKRHAAPLDNWVTGGGKLSRVLRVGESAQPAMGNLVDGFACIQGLLAPGRVAVPLEQR